MDSPVQQYMAGSGEEDDFAESAVTHSADASSIQDLAVRAQSGCAVAFAELHNRLRPRLIRFLEKRLFGTRVLADDVAAETLAKDWRAIDSYDPRFQFVTWVYSIAVRKVADHLRAARRTQLSPLPADVPSQTRTPSASLEDSEALGSIWSVAQNTLSDDQYAAVWLRFGEGLTIAEVAKVLGKSTVGVRVLLHRGRARLQRRLEQQKDLIGPDVSLARKQSESEQEQENQDVNEQSRAIDGWSSADGKFDEQHPRDQS